MLTQRKWRFICTLFLFTYGVGTTHGQLSRIERAQMAYERADELERVGDFAEAARYYKEASDDDRKNAEYKYKLAYVKTRLSPPETEAAIRILKPLKTHQKGSTLLGRLYLQQNRLNLAENALKRALELARGETPQSHFAVPHYFLGEIWSKRTNDPKSQQRAIEHYHAYLRSDGQGEFLETAEDRLRQLLYGQMGALAINSTINGELDRSERIVKELLKSKTEKELRFLLQELHYRRGVLHSKSDQPEAAKSEWEKAKDLIAARVKLGAWYYERGKIIAAIEQWEAATDLWEGAIGLWETEPEVASILPNGREEVQRAYYQLEQSYLQTDQPKKAARARQKLDLLDSDGTLNPTPPVIPNTGLNPEQIDRLMERFVEEHGGKIVNDAIQQDRLDKILTRILQRNFLYEPYSIFIVDTPKKGAWVIAGNRIFISTGLLAFVKHELQDDDDLLAFIIGHEVSHRVHRDIERSADALQMIKEVLAGRTRKQRLWWDAWNRQDELRADEYGALLAYRAGFDPMAALRWCEAIIRTDGDIDPYSNYPTYNKRKNLLQKYLRDDLQPAHRKFRNGVNALKRGDFPTASRYFRAYLVRFPYDKHTLNNLGVVYFQQALHKAEGIPHAPWRLVKGVEILPELRQPPIRPRTLLDAALMQQAISQFEAALRVDRSYKRALRNLGDVYADLRFFDKAEKEYRIALEIDPHSTEVLNSLAVLLCRQGQYSFGIETLNAVLKIDTNHPEARHNLQLARNPEKHKGLRVEPYVPAGRLHIKLQLGETTQRATLETLLNGYEYMTLTESASAADVILRKQGGLWKLLSSDGSIKAESDALRVESLVTAFAPTLEQMAVAKMLNAFQNSFPVKIKTNKGFAPTYQIGETIRFYFQVEQDCYVTLVNIGTDGTITKLFPNPYQERNYLLAGEVYTAVPDDAPQFLKIQGPTGTDVVVAIATTEPHQIEEFNWSSTRRLFERFNGTTSKNIGFDFQPSEVAIPAQSHKSEWGLNKIVIRTF